jgi:hypothetical protein
VLAEVQQRLGSHYDDPILEGHVLRLSLPASDGREAANIYVFERQRDPSAKDPGAYSIEVLVDQGGLQHRLSVAESATNAVAAFAKGPRGEPSAAEVGNLANAAYDLYLTSGAYTGGGAGHTHLMVAAAWQARTGADLPRANRPLDLFALTHTRQEFVDAFVNGELFVGGRRF